MAELTISPDEIRSALDEFVSSYQPAAASMTEVGVVATSAAFRERHHGYRPQPR